MRTFIWGVSIAALSALLPAPQTQTAQEPSEADWNWFSQFRTQAFDALMPMNSSSDLVFVAYRSYRDLYHEVLERHFTIRFNHEAADKDKLRATVVVPVGRSIQQQLLDLHMKDRAASFDSVLARIAVRRLTLDSVTCRAVRDRLDRLSKVNIALKRQDDVIYLHPFMHRFAINLFAGEVDTTLNDERTPLVRWGVETADALLACAPRS